MLKVFQIGGTAFNLYSQQLKHNYSSEGEAEPTRLLSGLNFLSKNQQFLHNPREITVTGLMINRFNLQSHQVENMLRRMVNKTVPIIAYITEDPESELAQCCHCSKVGGSCHLLWVQAMGTVVSVGSEGEDDLPRNLTVTLRLLTFWRALDPALWVFGGHPNSYDGDCCQKEIDRFELSEIPCSCELVRGCQKTCIGFHPIQYDSDEWIYDPQYWDIRDDAQECERCFGCYSEGYHRIRNGVQNIKYSLEGNSEQWSGPPNSIYWITDLTGSDIVIRTSGSDGGIYAQSYETIIDISATNDILVDNSLAPLASSDIIVVGDFHILRNNRVLRHGIIIRQGTILAFQPVVLYPNYFPGMMLSSRGFYTLRGALTHESIHFFRIL